MWNEMSWDRMPGTGTEVPTIGEFLAGNPVPHLVPHDMSVTLGVPSGARALQQERDVPARKCPMGPRSWISPAMSLKRVDLRFWDVGHPGVNPWTDFYE